jgi:hypothetical protein
MYIKKTESHPSKLPKLTDTEIMTLEQALRKQCDAWAWLLTEEEGPSTPQQLKESWINSKPPRIQRLASAVRQGAWMLARKLEKKKTPSQSS